jgi:hypothetical protein
VSTNNEIPLADDLLKGAQAIADYIGDDVRDTFYGLQKGYLPARKHGHHWISSKSALRRHFAIGDTALVKKSNAAGGDTTPPSSPPPKRAGRRGG